MWRQVAGGNFMELNGRCNDILVMEAWGVWFKTMPYHSQDKATHRSRDCDRGDIQLHYGYFGYLILYLRMFSFP